MLNPFETSGNNPTKPSHLPIPQASFIISRKPNLYCQHANCLTCLRCSLQGDISCALQAPLYLHRLWKEPKRRERYLLCTSLKSWDDLTSRVIIASLDFLSVTFAYNSLPTSMSFSWMLGLFFSFFLVPVSIKHCTMLRSLGIVVQEWVFGRHLLCFHEEVPKSSIRAWDPTFVI